MLKISGQLLKLKVGLAEDSTAWHARRRSLILILQMHAAYDIPLYI
jgi:hypothetical protein